MGTLLQRVSDNKLTWRERIWGYETLGRYRLSGDIGEGSISTKKMNSSNKTKVARFFRPFVANNNTEKIAETRTGDDGENVEHIISEAFQRVHVSFKSTSLCNIRAFNDLNSFKTSGMIGEIGKFDHRRYWGINMNGTRQLYLGSYSHIDSIDRLIKKNPHEIQVLEVLAFANDPCHASSSSC